VDDIIYSKGPFESLTLGWIQLDSRGRHTTESNRWFPAGRIRGQLAIPNPNKTDGNPQNRLHPTVSTPVDPPAGARARLPRHRLEPGHPKVRPAAASPVRFKSITLRPLRSMLPCTHEPRRHFALMGPPVSVRSARSSSRCAPPSGRRPPPSSQSASTPSPCSPTLPPHYQLTSDLSLSLSLISGERCCFACHSIDRLFSKKIGVLEQIGSRKGYADMSEWKCANNILNLILRN
jgi:hypothetical protein